MEKKSDLSIQNLPFRIGLAERIVEIRPLYRDICMLCRDYVLSDQQTEPEIIVTVSETDINREAEAARRENEKAGLVVAYSSAYLESITVYRQIAAAMVEKDTLMMHGVVISTRGEGYMITALSGVGKTTRAKLWVDHVPDSFVVNGDKPLLRVTDSGVYAYGTPWCGKEGLNVNTSVPLRAILLLERSDDGNRMEEVGFGEAFPALLRQTFRPGSSQARRQTLSLLQAIAGKVKLYRFCSEPTVEAVQLAWETAWEKQ